MQLSRGLWMTLGSLVLVISGILAGLYFHDRQRSQSVFNIDGELTPHVAGQKIKELECKELALESKLRAPIADEAQREALEKEHEQVLEELAYARLEVGRKGLNKLPAYETTLSQGRCMEKLALSSSQ